MKNHTHRLSITVSFALIFGIVLLLNVDDSMSSIMPGTATTKNIIETALLKLSKLNEAASNKEPVQCTCGVFLSGQFKKGSTIPPKGNPALLYEQEMMLQCNAQGTKMCTNRCLEVIVKHLPNSPNIICGTIDRDCHRERAYLFVQSCNGTWTNTNLSAGREYCCKDGVSIKCQH